MKHVFKDESKYTVLSNNVGIRLVESCVYIHRLRTKEYIDPDHGFFDMVVWPYHCDMVKRVQQLSSGNVNIWRGKTYCIVGYNGLIDC